MSEAICHLLYPFFYLVSSVSLSLILPPFQASLPQHVRVTPPQRTYSQFKQPVQNDKNHGFTIGIRQKRIQMDPLKLGACDIPQLHLAPDSINQLAKLDPFFWDGATLHSAAISHTCEACPLFIELKSLPVNSFRFRVIIYGFYQFNHLPTLQRCESLNHTELLLAFLKRDQSS